LINYQELFVNQRNSLFYVPPVQAIANSVLFASATTLLSVILGLITVIGFKRKSGLSQILSPILMLPLGASAVILGLGFVVFFGQIPGALSFFPFLIPVVHSLVAYPFVVRALQPAVAAIPESLHSAAATLGASPSKIFWQIDIPVLKRPLIVAAIFAFSISLGEFGATIFLARPEYPTIPVAIYRFLAQPGALNYGQAMAMASILMALCALCTLMMGVFLPKRARVST
jgi:thiamine transport system permease protein